MNSPSQLETEADAEHSYMRFGLGRQFKLDGPAWEESKEKDGPGEGSIWGFGSAKEFGLLGRTCGPVGNAECCC